MTDPAITASGIMEIYKATVIIRGPTEGDFKEAGTKIKCMVAERIIGETVELIQAITSWEKNKDSGSTGGLMVEFTRVSGIMVDNTATEDFN